MKPLVIVTVGILATVFVGCDANNLQVEQDDPGDAMLRDSLHDSAINKAIIAQHTLYRYHFVPDSARLNELGERDLAVLTGHYREYPGKLNIQRGNTPADIYDARVQTVADTMARAGVGVERIMVSQDLPGGQGMASEDVLGVIDRQADPLSAESTTGSGSSGTTGGRP